MSPVYRDIENGADMRHENHREMFPSIMNSSISSSIIHPDNDSDEEPLNAQNGLNNEDAAAIADAHQNALLTESDQEDGAEYEGEEPELHHANTVLQGDAHALIGMNSDPAGSGDEDRND